MHYAFKGLQMDNYATSSLNYITAHGAPTGVLPNFLADSFGGTQIKGCAYVPESNKISQSNYQK